MQCLELGQGQAFVADRRLGGPVKTVGRTRTTKCMFLSYSRRRGVPAGDGVAE